MRQFRRRLARLEGDRQPASGLSRPPLTRRILQEPVPERFKMPHIDPYEGTTDPFDHLESYKALMRIQGATDALLCIAFPATLRKSARVWYSRLEPRSIDSFGQLETKFATYFSAHQAIPREPDTLFSIQQEGKESLREYLLRFKMATLEIYNLDDTLAMTALKRGIRNSRLACSLDKKPARDYADVLLRVEKYIRAEEGANSRRLAEEKQAAKKVREDRRPAPARRPDHPELRGPRRLLDHPGRPPRGPRERDPRERGPLSRAPRDFQHYTPLLLPPSEILMQIEGEPYMRRPPPLRPDSRRDTSKFCHYHREPGHNTDECFQLRREIEELIHRGLLRKYVRGPGEPAKAGASAKGKEVVVVPDNNPPTGRPVDFIDNRPTGWEVGLIGLAAKEVSVITPAVGQPLKRPRQEGGSGVRVPL